MDKYRAELDVVFLAMGNPMRRAIVHRLAAGALAVSELAAPFPIALPSFMKHLQVLERAGVIRSTKVGRTRTCTLKWDQLDAAEHWLNEQRRICAVSNLSACVS